MHFHRKPTTFVGQVNLKVQNLERSIDFYQEVIGFKVLEQTERKADLTADGKTVLLSIEQPNNVVPKQGRTTGLYHFALLLPKRSDLAEIVQHFMEDRKSTRLNSSHVAISYAVFCLKKKNKIQHI